MSETKCKLLWLALVIWGITALAFPVRAQERIDLAHNVLIQKKLGTSHRVTGAVGGFGGAESVPAEGGGCNDTQKDVSPGGSLGDVWWGGSDQKWFALPFTAGSTYNICTAKVYLKKDGTCTGNITAYIYNTSSNVPGSAIATSTNTVAASGIGAGYAYYSWTFAGDVQLTNSIQYYIALGLSAACSGSDLSYQYDGDGNEDGTADSNDGASWTQHAAWTTATFETRD